ncbi:MAG: glycosyltransferase [Cuniculiplasma divulgatum]|nr:MAG: glycosyltransferase [Cuniculiplasma divulgatum]
MNNFRLTNIAILNNKEYETGIGRYSLNMHKTLLKHGINSTLYQLFTHNHYRVTKQEDIYGINLGKYSNFLNTAFLSLYQRKIKHVVKGNIIHISDPSISNLVKIFPSAVLTVHDLYYVNNKCNSRITSLMMKESYRQINSFEYILVDSDFTKKSLIKELKTSYDKIFLVYPGIDINAFKNKNIKNKKLIGFTDSDIVLLNVAYDNPNKNLKFLYKILSSLPANYKLVRIGKNTKENVEYTKKIDVYSRIKFIENLNDCELIKYYQNSDIFVYPSFFDGFGYGNVEAMASGLPVITSDIPLMKEIVGNCGILLDIEKFDQWIDAILSLSDLEKYNYFSLLGVERANNFSLENEFNQLKNFYELENLVK